MLYITLENESEALAQLPDFSAPDSEMEAAMATGTDDEKSVLLSGMVSEGREASISSKYEQVKGSGQDGSRLIKKTPESTAFAGSQALLKVGAGEGNRTLVASLEGVN